MMKRPHMLHPHRGEGQAETDDAHGHGGLPVMLTVDDVAGMLRCSSRSVYRLADAGRLPRPVKLGGLVRWRRETIEDWIARGCPRAAREEVAV